jgi:hypothetical protein
LPPPPVEECDQIFGGRSADRDPALAQLASQARREAVSRKDADDRAARTDMPRRVLVQE